MTINENINEEIDAVCIANNAGRILSANKRFCKLFGFDQSEVKWHYLCDLYRQKRGFNIAPERDEVLQIKVRNRAGRSFPCVLKLKHTQSLEGIPLMMHYIQRVGI